ncbi:MAG: DEAD/DEAH box helicase [Prevotellaceae bacterium]|nr:DEAD/DEAH box helicase [Prevotellaceae bacterium]
MENNNRHTQRRLSNIIKPAYMGLEEWQVALRQQQAEREHFAISEVSELFCPGEYNVRNHKTRSQYRVVYRGVYSPWNYCSCPDFRTSGLGTCKHVEGVKLWLLSEGKEPYSEEPRYSSVYVDYRGQRSIRIRFGQDHRRELTALAEEYFGHDSVLRPEAYVRFDTFLEKARSIDPEFRCHPDALEVIISQRERIGRISLMESVYTDETLDALLTTRLYPYQKEGVRFAVKAGKAIIADEMGLGKTIQAICCAEIYLRQKMAESVLIVCPTSLKYQWKSEIERFITPSGSKEGEGRGVILIEGYASHRLELYKATAPYKIVSYQSLANDIKSQNRLSVDLLIMDEVQRLKNWNTQLAQTVRRIDSHYSVLLSGTPLENKLDELVSIVQLADPYCLSPLYRFRHEHVVTDPASGKTIGYKNLNDIRQRLSNTLIRRTKQGVRLQLPKRTDQYVLIPMTQQQSNRHEELRTAIARLVSKWMRTRFLSEEERRRMLLMFGQMRMLADSTFVIDQDLEHRHDVKITEVLNILYNVLEGSNAKIVIFSEWERMARLVAMELDSHNLDYEFLHGGIQAMKRNEIIERFTNDSECRIFLSTDAGSTGLNLQAASILINLDLPWNPAVLEQRIGRIYRIGQEMPVQVLNLVSKDSIEEKMIDRLRFKRSLFEGTLDGGDDTIFLNDERFQGFMNEMADMTIPADNPCPNEEICPALPFESLSTVSDSADAQTTVEKEKTSDINLPASDEGTTLSFLASLRDILQSPEKTKELADAITKIIDSTTI